MLMDNFNRIINYLRISITDRCNLRCKYCTEAFLPSIGHDDVLRYEEIVRLTRIAASLASARCGSPEASHSAENRFLFSSRRSMRSE